MAFFGKDFNDPKTQAILNASAALLGNSNRPGQTFGGAMSQGMLGGIEGMQQGQQAQDELKERELQAKRHAAAMEQLERKQMIQESIMGRIGGESGGSGGLNLQNALALKLAGGPDLLAEVKYAQQGVKKSPGQYYDDPMTGAREYMPDANKAFNVGSDGAFVPNNQYQAYSNQKAASSAPRISVDARTTVDNRAAGKMADQVGSMLKESQTEAVGAANMIDASNRVLQAVDLGGVITGPAAGARMKMRQIGAMLGVGGADNESIIANTRQSIRALAEMTLAGRKQMKGQGAISDSEQSIAQKAVSGELSDLTIGELRMLANASGRSAKWTLNEHKRKMEVARGIDGTGGIVDMFDSPFTPEESGDAISNTRKSKFKVVR